MRLRKEVLPVVLGGLLVAGAAGIVVAQSRTTLPVDSARPAQPSSTPVRPWSAAGGEVGIRWNTELASDLGIGIVADAARGKRAQDGSELFAVTGAESLQFRVEGSYLRGFIGGAVQARGGYSLALADGRIDLTDFRLVPGKAANGKLRLDVVDADGMAWFYVDRIMHELFDAQDPALTVSSSDLRISPRLARRLGHPYAAGWTVGEVQLELPVTAKGSGLVPMDNAIRWHGEPAPGGNTYQNDLFMIDTTAQYLRCQGCSGNNGSGLLVITPASTLRNNVNDGNIAATVPGDPLGTSSARQTASIPWYTKFSGNFAPYNNDQHPYLIWNMYRINADGSLEQIGRSGVKQAFLTTNDGCLDSNDHNSHVLGRGCADTYSVGNNDNNLSLSPRSEILPATGQWGRCGSIFDVNCDGVQNPSPAPDNYYQRMIVGESQIAPNPGASWLLESWYLAREDINIYNSMSTLQTTQQWTGSVWNVGHGNEQLGSAIDRWFAIGASQNPRLTRLTRHIEEIVVDGARAKLAVKVKQVAGGWRYDYAVMNFEFAFAETSGSEPNLRVVSTQGFDGFGLATASAAQATATVFRDGDLDSGNDWQVSTAGNAIKWSDDSSAEHSLGWGMLYSFSVTSPRAPRIGTATLHADNAPTPSQYQVQTLVPAP